MTGWEMVMLLGNTTGVAFWGRTLLTVPQYTGWSWFSLFSAMFCGFGALLVLTNT